MIIDEPDLPIAASESAREGVVEPSVEPTVGRRRLINGLAIGGAVVGVGVASAAVARATGTSVYRAKALTVDVACLGNEYIEAAQWSKAGDNDFRVPFLVEGWIFPSGTITGDGYIPREENSIGRWLCRGYAVGTDNRDQPHVSSHQDFIFGSIRPERVFPQSIISTAGLEGTTDRSQVSVRSIIGGTGAYLGATGQTFGYLLGENSTVFFGNGGQAPSFRFEFDMRVLEAAGGPTD
ncbi:MAG: hypothetical protein AAB131_14565 [Actinomycetota bacterium]